jgi:hypothetical protein
MHLIRQRPIWRGAATVGVVAVAVVVVGLVLGCDNDSAQQGSPSFSPTTLGTGEANTFEGDGYSFSYPKELAQRSGVTEGGEPATVFVPDAQTVSVVASTPDLENVWAPGDDVLVVIAAPQSEPLLEGEFDEYLQVRRARLKEQGKLLEDTTRVTVAGFPAIRSVLDLGDGVALRETIIPETPTWYFLECRFSSEDMDRGCRQVEETFAVD